MDIHTNTGIRTKHYFLQCTQVDSHMKTKVKRKTSSFNPDMDARVTTCMQIIQTKTVRK